MRLWWVLCFTLRCLTITMPQSKIAREWVMSEAKSDTGKSNLVCRWQLTDADEEFRFFRIWLSLDFYWLWWRFTSFEIWLLRWVCFPKTCFPSALCIKNIYYWQELFRVKYLQDIFSRSILLVFHYSISWSWLTIFKKWQKRLKTN